MGRVNTEEIIPAKDPLKLNSRRVVWWREGSIHKDKGRFTRLEFGKWRDLDKSSKLWSPHWLPIGHVVKYFFLFLVFFHVGLFSSEVPIPINRIREIWGFIFNQSLRSVFWVLSVTVLSLKVMRAWIEGQIGTHGKWRPSRAQEGSTQTWRDKPS